MHSILSMEHEHIIRLAVFLGAFALLAACENLAPKRVLKQPRIKRWGTNIGISILNTVTLNILAVALPLLAVGAAWDAQTQGWGLLNQISLPFGGEVVLAVLLFDLAIWAQHLISHKIPLLWRLHQVHHADVDLDVTTAIRFHPIEIALSMLLKIALVYLLGPSAFAIIVFEILLNGTAMFNHANLNLPKGVDRMLRLVIVTPDMHRIHHSVHRHEHDSNYGFALSVWDRLFGTYRHHPKGQHTDMALGLRWQDNRPSQLLWALKLPFWKK